MALVAVGLAGGSGRHSRVALEARSSPGVGWAGDDTGWAKEDGGSPEMKVQGATPHADTGGHGAKTRKRFSDVGGKINKHHL